MNLLKLKNFLLLSSMKIELEEFFPVFFAVIIATYLIAYFYLLPTDLVAFVKSSLYSLGLSSNF